MSVYSGKDKGWRFDFILKGTRYTSTWFKTKTEAKKEEAKRREEIKKPIPEKETPTDIVFLELINRRLDHVEAYNSPTHYRDYRYMGRRWAKRWENLMVSEISRVMVQDLILERKKVSACTANQELRYLRATFNFGIKEGWITHNPTQRIDFFPLEKKVKYIPPPEDIDKVISVADLDSQDYLLTIRETLGRVGEINRLTWEDVNLEDRYIILYTRKKKGGHLTPRKVPMTQRLLEILTRRYLVRDKNQPLVFSHEYWSRKNGRLEQGAYKDRKRLMAGLCKKAGVKYFRFHALRHSGASIMENHNVPIGSIQRILGHENRTTTEIYLHSIGSAEWEAMAVLERANKKSHTDSHTVH